MHCPFCYIKQKPGVISLETITSFIEKHAKDMIRTIIFHGGEPLLYAAVLVLLFHCAYSVSAALAV